MNFRIGEGWDVHALVPGRRLVIGGVDIAHPTGLLGHSDADVLLHAITDALLGAAGLAVVAVGLWKRSHGWPFLGGALVFLSGYIGLAVSFFPSIVPYDIDFRTAANADNALGLMLWGIAILLPAILGYTVWVYWIFRGKVAADAGYH